MTRVGSPNWRFITNHAAVLLTIAEQPSATIAEIGRTVAISRRSAQNIISDLAEGGYVTRELVGRKNHYSINAQLPLRHPAVRDRASVQALLGLLN